MSQARLHVRYPGPGTDRAAPILALHGWAGTGDTFLPLAAALGGSRAIVAPDLPGYGLSAAPDVYDLHHIADLVAQHVADRLAPDTTLVGTCSGAVLAALVAQRLECVRHLVLVEAFATVPWYFRLLASPPGRFFYYCAFETRLGKALVNGGPATGASDLSSSFNDVDPGVALGWLRALVKIRDVRRLPAPSLDSATILVAQHTFAAVRRSVPRWQEWLNEVPSVNVREIADAGHRLLEDAPGAARAALRRVG